jgi:hypothetical protein
MDGMGIASANNSIFDHLSAPRHSLLTVVEAISM